MAQSKLKIYMSNKNVKSNNNLTMKEEDVINFILLKINNQDAFNCFIKNIEKNNIINIINHKKRYKSR